MITGLFGRWVQMAGIASKIKDTVSGVGLFRVVIAGIAAGVALFGGSDLVRSLEADWAILVASAFSDNVGVTDFPGRVQITPPGEDLLLVNVTRTCSAIIGIACILVLGITLIRSSLRKRLIAVGLASAFIVVSNHIRLVLILLVGGRFGATTLIVVHDWVGTALSVATVSYGVILLFRTATDTDTAEVIPA